MNLIFKNPLRELDGVPDFGTSDYLDRRVFIDVAGREERDEDRAPGCDQKNIGQNGYYAFAFHRFYSFKSSEISGSVSKSVSGQAHSDSSDMQI